ncbi:MAG: hypothetical protein QW327_06920 [Candidatus Odinarchaeota archaeon]
MKKKCTVLNCGREVAEGEYVTINGSVFCIECATLLNKKLVTELFQRG